MGRCLTITLLISILSVFVCTIVVTNIIDTSFKTDIETVTLHAQTPIMLSVGDETSTNQTDTDNDGWSDVLEMRYQ